MTELRAIFHLRVAKTLRRKIKDLNHAEEGDFHHKSQ